ncbi:MAG: hypothetical protein ACLVD4_07690 [Negativibacillus sp.]|jgi:hypothetical protein
MKSHLQSDRIGEKMDCFTASKCFHNSIAHFGSKSKRRRRREGKIHTEYWKMAKENQKEKSIKMPKNDEKI